MRVQSSTKMKNGGWLHRGTPHELPPLPPKRAEVKIDAHAIWAQWFDRTKAAQLIELGEAIGVDPIALSLCGCAWAPEHKAFAFPMYDGGARVIGIRLRNLQGHKWAVTGSKQGLFLPSKMLTFDVLIVEGATDTCVALNFGYSVIGRPSCLGQTDYVAETIKRHKFRRAIIVGDNDGVKKRPDGTQFYPGQDGAKELQCVLPIPSVIWFPPCKDFRGFVQHGGGMEFFNMMMKDLVWVMPSASSSKRR